MLHDVGRREPLDEHARQRAVDVIDWRVQALSYIAVFDRLIGRAQRDVVVLPDQEASGRFRVVAERRSVYRPLAAEVAALVAVPAQRAGEADLVTGETHAAAPASSGA